MLSMSRRLIVGALVTATISLPAAPARAGDLVVPARGPERGTALLFRRGAWMGGSESDMLDLAQQFSERGWRGVSVAYPLHDVPGSYQAAAVAATAYRTASEPLVAVGESAGGTIAEWLAARARVDRAVAVAAPSDFSRWRLIHGGPWPWWPAAVGIEDELWRWSPARLYRARTSAPLAVYQSRDDAVVEPAQAREMHARGAELHWLRGDHLADTSWRPAVVAKLTSTRR